MQYLKGLFTLITVILIWFGKAKADTIDNWTVKYNNKVVRKLNLLSDNKVVRIALNKVTTSDKISVEYDRDTPCFDCNNALITVEDKKRGTIIASGKGTSTPLVLYVKDLLNRKSKSLNVYYHEARRPDVFLFRVRLTTL